MIKKNLIVTILDSIDLASGIETDVISIKTSIGSQIIVESVTQKLAIRIEDLQEAITAIKEFKATLPPEEAIVEPTTSQELFTVEYGSAE